MLTLLLIMSFSVAAFADDKPDKEKDLEQQYEESKGKINEYNDKIADLKDKILSEQSQVTALENNIVQVNSDIKNLETQITDMTKKIDTTTKELNIAIADYNTQDDRMKNRINAMYKNGTSMGYLEVILESKSFADFISKADIMKKIVDYDMDLLKEMREKREEINNKKLGLEKDKSDLVAMKNTLDQKKQSFTEQNNQKKSVVALLSREKSDYESLRKQEEANAAKINNEINVLRSYKGQFNGEVRPILHKSDFPSGVVPRISSTFGYRIDPITGGKAYHSGLDIATKGYKNIPVYAMAEGKVIIARYEPAGYGNVVVIDHGSGFATLYGHNNQLLVKTGDTVEAGQEIALSGSTGRSTGPHVHFGVQHDGNWVDPAPYYILGS